MCIITDAAMMGLFTFSGTFTWLVDHDGNA